MARIGFYPALKSNLAPRFLEILQKCKERAYFPINNYLNWNIPDNMGTIESPNVHIYNLFTPKRLFPGHCPKYMGKSTGLPRYDGPGLG